MAVNVDQYIVLSFVTLFQIFINSKYMARSPKNCDLIVQMCIYNLLEGIESVGLDIL